MTVQRDDGQTVRIAQRDDGDIQLGDRVQIVQDSRGVAKVVRDTSRASDRTAAGYGPPQGGPAASGASQDYGPSQGRYPQPQDDPRYGTLN